MTPILKPESRKRHLRRSLSSMAALVLLLGACGSSEPTTTHPAPAHPQTTEGGQSAGGSVHPPGWGKPPPARLQLAVPTTSTATMYDSITLSTVPPRPFALAGYTAGWWPTYGPMRARWPMAHTVSIAIAARYHADCADVEPGDLNPSEIAGWVKADKAAGFAKPCVYSSYYEFIERVRPALRAAGIARSVTFDWDASYTYRPHLDIGFDASQWTDTALGRNLDASVVTLPFLSIAQPPWVPAPSPTRRAKEARILVLRYVLLHRGCRRRVAHHEHLGPRCRRWFAEGNRLHRELAHA
jgi:hypothetical protein